MRFLLVLALLVPSAAYAKLGIFMSRDYYTATDTTPGLFLEAMTPILEMGGVDYEIYIVENVGTTQAAAINAICDDFDDDYGITVGLWIGGNHDDAASASYWSAADVVKTSQGHTPDYPMIWMTNDSKFYFDIDNGSSTRNAQGTTVISGDYVSKGIPIGGTYFQEYDTGFSGNITPLLYEEGDTTNLVMWRTTGTGPHANGWTFLFAPLDDTNRISGIGENGQQQTPWWCYLAIAECVHYDGTLWRRDRPIYYGVHIDDEFRGDGTATSDGFPYDVAWRTDDWYDSESLQTLADSLASWGDVIVALGGDADSVVAETEEVTAKAAIYNNPSYSPYFDLQTHTHTSNRDALQQEIVSDIVARASVQQPGFRRVFPGYDIDDYWTSGGNMMDDWWYESTFDSVMAGLSSSNTYWVRSSVVTAANDPVTALSGGTFRNKPNINNYMRRHYDGNWFYWYNWGRQMTSDTLAYNGVGAGYADTQTLFPYRIFDRITQYRFIVIFHVIPFSYEQPAITMLNIWRSMFNTVNGISGKTILAFGDSKQVIQNYYYRP